MMYPFSHFLNDRSTVWLSRLWPEPLESFIFNLLKSVSYQENMIAGVGVFRAFRLWIGVLEHPCV